MNRTDEEISRIIAALPDDKRRQLREEFKRKYPLQLDDIPHQILDHYKSVIERMMVNQLEEEGWEI